MQNEIRTFIAVKINPETKLLEELQKFRNGLVGERIKWVDENNFHLTLRFLGNTTREQLYELVDRLEEVAAAKKSLKLKIKGAGYFKSKGNPRVVFIRITDSEALMKLVEEIEKTAVATGFEEELKSFQAHLTLGRIKYLENRKRFYSMMDRLEAMVFQTVEIDEFILYQSILRPEGPIYKIIKKFVLK